MGGKRTYLGLPNNPNYDLPALAGSPCDTLVGKNELAITNTNANLHVYYAPDWEKAFINADKLKGKNYRLRMVDVLGKEVYTESGALNSKYFTRDLNCASFASGIYLITFETEKERLVKKMQINWR
ncbi:MAG: T9SS type A sorting domain-containing protein [Bacteroidetes bacterium]|nr:T9SS type A sorting domain-containing protein [Bacteroidota bacterium]